MDTRSLLWQTYYLSNRPAKVHTPLHFITLDAELMTLVSLNSACPRTDELDSFMYQTVGHDAIHLYAECMALPLYRREIQGGSLVQEADYTVTQNDETEDLFQLLKEVKVREFPYFIEDRVNRIVDDEGRMLWVIGAVDIRETQRLCWKHSFNPLYTPGPVESLPLENINLSRHALPLLKAKHPDVQAVSVGAILSNYQRVRVEHV